MPESLLTEEKGMITRWLCLLNVCKLQAQEMVMFLITILRVNKNQTTISKWAILQFQYPPQTKGHDVFEFPGVRHQLFPHISPKNSKYSKHLLNDLIWKLKWMHYYILRLKTSFQRFWNVKHQICKASILDTLLLIYVVYQNIFPFIDGCDLKEL